MSLANAHWLEAQADEAKAFAKRLETARDSCGNPYARGQINYAAQLLIEAAEHLMDAADDETEVPA